MLSVFSAVGVVALTGPGSVVPAAAAAGDHVVVEAGQLPPGAGATCTDPGRLEVVAQLMYAEVWVRSVTYGARVRERHPGVDAHQLGAICRRTADEHCGNSGNNTAQRCQSPSRLHALRHPAPFTIRITFRNRRKLPYG